MEGVPRSIDYSDLKRDLKSIGGVNSVHSLHLWSLTLDRNAVAVHLAIGMEKFPYLFSEGSSRDCVTYR